MKLSIIKSFYLLLTSTLLISCGKAPPSYSPWGGQFDDLRELRIGISPDYPPIAFKESGKLQGVEINLSEYLANEFKTKMIYREMPFDKLIPSLVNNKIDIIMSGMSITAERQQQVSFAEPYMQVGQMALIRKNEKSRFPNPDSLLNSQVRIGYIADTTSDLFVHKHFQQKQLLKMKSVAAAVKNLRQNSIDVFIHDAPTIWLIAGNPTELELTGLYWPLTREYLAWAVRPTDYQLLDSLNKVIAKWRQSGNLQKILDNWIRTRIVIEP